MFHKILWPEVYHSEKRSDIDTEAFRSDITELDIFKNHKNMDLNTLVDNYNTELGQLLDRHAPLRTKILKNRRREPWFNGEARKALRESRSHERKWRKRKDNHVLEQKFKTAQNHHSYVLKTSKQAHFMSILDSHSNDQAKLFREMDRVMHRNPKTSLPDHMDSKILADEFCDFFQDKVRNIRSNFDDVSEKAFEFDSNSACSFPPLETFKGLTQDDVKRIIMKTASKSCELDPLPTTLLKSCLDDICPIITSIVNKSLSSSQMPPVFKQAIVRPLLKKPTLEPTLKNYRPVSNLAYISKVIEEAASQQLAEHIETNSLADPLQLAYKSKHSTETALLKVCNDILTDLDNGRAVFLSMLDLSAAFDTVDHSILLRRIRTTFNIKGAVLDWLESYLSERSLRVCINGVYSDPIILDCSLPKGSQMGPKRYSDYVMPLGRLIRLLQLMYHYYADDAQVGQSFLPKNEDSQLQAVRNLEYGVSQISNWMTIA